MEEDGFVLIKNRRRKKRRIVASTRLKILTDDLNEIPIFKIDTVIEQAIKRLCLSPFCDKVLSLLDYALGGRRLSQINAIGLGNFCESRFNGSSQTALLVILKEHFKCEVQFREPLTTLNEREWLNSKGIRVKECSDLLERLFIDENAESGMCLCYMPHCGHALYNNVIYAHRAECDIRRVIIFGNDLQDMQIVRSHANELDALCEYREHCETIQVPPFDDAPFAFNNTAIHFLKFDSSIPLIHDHLPHYDFYAPEIVLKKPEP